ncbi:hypothetical protein XENOCAPTIV_006342 [Xenoophorus captivus]|uniref:Uncharacterized protein n=1 Tax=Xenoophorus captivus TaxID=1517983 RepID=A0ABV0QGT2_9TELE
MFTEYQDSFRLPRKYTTITFTSKQKNLCHQQRGTGANIALFRRKQIFKQQTSNPPKSGRPSVPPKNQTGTAGKLTHTTVTKTVCKTDYTTVYQNDFQAWIPDKLQPFRPKDSIRIDNWLSETGRSKGGRNNSAANEQRKPFESLTTYRRDYVPHPVQPRRNKVFNQSREVLPETYAPNQEHLDFFQQFETWSIGTEDLNPPAVRTFHIPKYKEAYCQGFQKSLSTRKIREKKPESQEVRKALEWSCNDTSSETKTPHSKRITRTASKGCCDGMERNQNPAGNLGFPAFKCSSCMVWSGPLMEEMSWCSLSHT